MVVVWLFLLMGVVAPPCLKCSCGFIRCCLLGSGGFVYVGECPVGADAGEEQDAYADQRLIVSAFTRKRVSGRGHTLVFLGLTLFGGACRACADAVA